MKIKGYEFKEFYANTEFWPDGAWWSGDILVDGVNVDAADIDLFTIGDEASVTVDAIVCPLEGSEEGAVSMEAHFKRWKKAQTRKKLLIEVSVEQVEEIVALVKSLGGKVL